MDTRAGPGQLEVPQPLPCPWNVCCAGHSHSGSHFKGCSLEKTVCYWHHLEGICGWTTFCCCSVAQSCPTLCDPMDCSAPGLPVLHHLSELAQIHVHWVSDAIQPSYPLLSPSLPAPNPSQHQGIFQWVSSSLQVAKMLVFQLQHQSFQWIFKTSFRMDWLDLLAVQGRLKSLLQHHSSKASILQSSAFFIVQLSHPYMTTGKTIALTIWTFVSRVMSLFFNMLSMFVISFIPRNKHLLIS